MAEIAITIDPAVILGDALVSLINGSTWKPENRSPLNFTARRLYQIPGYKPDDPTLRVDLIIQEKEPVELADRGGILERSFDVAIGIQKIVANQNDVAEVDGLRNFVTTLFAFFDVQVELTLSGGQRIRCVTKKQSVPYHPQELDENSRFFALLDFEYVGWFPA